MRSRVRENLAFYAIGVAIGLCIVGTLMLVRRQMAHPPQPVQTPQPTPAQPVAK